MLSYSNALKEQLLHLSSNDVPFLPSIRKQIDENTYQSTLMETLIHTNKNFMLGIQEIDKQIDCSELCVGFYSPEEIAFDLNIGNVFHSYYRLKPNEICYVKNAHNENVFLPITNIQQGISIDNVKSITKDKSLFFIGVALDDKERKETILSRQSEIVW